MYNLKHSDYKKGDTYNLADNILPIPQAILFA